MAAQSLGYHVHVYSPGANTPAGQSADLEITAPYLDEDALKAFSQDVDVVTFEFENIPLAAIDVVNEFVPVRPGRNILATAQNRLLEKRFISELGIDVPRFLPVEGPDDIRSFFSEGKFDEQAVLKSAESGYDGKGQTVVNGAGDAEDAWNRIGGCSAIVEEKIDFEIELSVVGARSIDGKMEWFGPILNDHQNHILDVSVAPANSLPTSVSAAAISATQAIMEHFDLCGVLCVEFFLTSSGRLLVNEIAPRPHNSGHMTIEAATTSQFEQQARAVCGLPLGSMRQKAPAAMANLLGQHLNFDQPNWSSMFQSPTVKLHLYGKAAPRVDRKMGHLTALAERTSTAESLVRSARSAIAQQNSNEDFSENTISCDSE